MKLLFLDLETTGLDPKKNGIIQIAGAIEIDGKIKEHFNLEVAPFAEDVIDNKALAINKKTKDEIMGFSHPRVVYRSLVQLLERHVNKRDRKDKYYMVGQNTKFDYDFLNEWFKKNGNKYIYGLIHFHLIDLIALTTAFKLAGKVDTPDMKLGTIAKHFNMVFDAHDALNDVRMTWAIFHKYIDMIRGGDSVAKTYTGPAQEGEGKEQQSQSPDQERKVISEQKQKDNMQTQYDSENRSHSVNPVSQEK